MTLLGPPSENIYSPFGSGSESATNCNEHNRRMNITGRKILLRSVQLIETICMLMRAFRAFRVAILGSSLYGDF